MIDVMENKILGPAFLKGLEQGRRQGRLEGIREGKQDLLHDQLSFKFGPLPEWVAQRLISASEADIHKWAIRLLTRESLEDTLR